MFGALTALFSALGFAGLIVTVLLQRDQLKMQADQLQKATTSQIRSDELFEKQAKSMALGAAINAIKYRLDQYGIQIKENEDRNPNDRIERENGRQISREELVKELRSERFEMTKQLDVLLRKAVEADS